MINPNVQRELVHPEAPLPPAGYGVPGGVGPQSIDTLLPKFSGQLALLKLPKVKYDAYENAEYEFDPAQTTHPCSLRMAKRMSYPEGRLGVGGLDMRWMLAVTDRVNGARQVTLGRRYVVSNAHIAWESLRLKSETEGKMVPAPTIAALASDVVPKDVHSSLQALKAHFTDAVGQQDQLLGAGFRANLRKLLVGEYEVSAVLYRLAALYLACSWAELNRQEFRSHIPQGELAEFANLTTTAQFVQAADQVVPGGVMPVVLHTNGEYIDTTEALGVLRFALTARWQHNCENLMPGCVTSLPPVPGVRVYNSSHLAQNPPVPGLITSHVVWDTACTYALQHNVLSQFQGMVSTAATLWFSPAADLVPVCHSRGATMVMRPLSSASTLLLPITLNPTSWLGTTGLPPPPDQLTLFVDHCATSMVLGCCYRAVGMLHSLPTAVYMARAKTELGEMLKAMSRFGASHAKAMLQASKLMHRFGGEGAIGYVLASLSPRFRSNEQVLEWWGQHATAYQWEEVMPVVDELPDNSGLAGLFDPLLTKGVATLGRWYAVETSIADRCSTPHAMQRLTAERGVEVAVALTGALDGSRSLYHYDMPLGYRGLFSDWLFFKPFSRQAAAAEMVFRVTSMDSALTLSHGPIGHDTREFYIGASAEVLGLAGDLQPDQLDFDLGPRPGGLTGPRPGAPLTGGNIVPPGGPAQGGGSSRGPRFTGSGPSGRAGDETPDVSDGEWDEKASQAPADEPLLGGPTSTTGRAVSASEAADHELMLRAIAADRERHAREEAERERASQSRAFEGPPPVADAASEHSAASVSPSVGTVQTETTVTQTQQGAKHKITGKHVVLPAHAEGLRARAEAAFARTTAARKGVLLDAFGKMYESGSQPMRLVAEGMLEFFERDASGAEAMGNAISVVGPVCSVTPAEVLATVPPSSRAAVARAASKAFEITASMVPRMPMADAQAVKYAGVAAAMAQNPAITPEEVIRAVGRERWDLVKDNRAGYINQCVEHGFPVTSGFPKKYTPKGADKTRVAVYRPFANDPDAMDKNFAATRQFILDGIQTSREYFNKPQPTVGSNPVMPSGELHDPAVVALASAESSVLTEAELEAAAEQQRCAEEEAFIEALNKPGSREHVLPPVSEEVTDDTDFESASPSTSVPLGLDSANYGETAHFDTENPALSQASSQTSLPPPGQRGKKGGFLGTTASLASMAFGRPGGF